MKKIILGSLVAFVCLAMASCSDDNGVKPDSITNLRYEAKPGYVVIRWDKVPETSNIRYVKFMYYDQLTKKTFTRTASAFSDSIVIPDMRKKYGDYTFTVQSVSPDGTNGNIQDFNASCEAAPATYTATGNYTLTANMISANFIESTEGSIEALVDGNTATYFHSPWSGDPITDFPYLQIHFAEPLNDCVKWAFTTRNKRCIPNDIEFEGSTDGTNWFLIKHYTTGDGLPSGSPAVAISTFDLGITPLPADHKTASYFRIIVKATNTGDTDPGGTYPCFNMSELSWFTVETIDPEAPDK